MAPRGIPGFIARLLDRDFNRVAVPVLRRIAQASSSGIIAQRLKELDSEVARLTADGAKRLRPDNPVFRALLADLADELADLGDDLTDAAGAVQGAGIRSSSNAQRRLALAGLSEGAAARIGLTWNTPDVDALLRVVNYTDRPAWRALLATFSDGVVDTVRNQAVQGVVRGWSPVRTAAMVTHVARDLPFARASAILRTTQLTSYREATTISQMANRRIASRIIRIASLDERTCLSCIAAHGDVLWDVDRDGGSAPVPRVDDHYNGRCTSMVVVRGRQVQIQSGEQWFNGLSPSQKRDLAPLKQSPGKLRALDEGKVTLNDFRHVDDDPTFGEMLNEASLADALENAGR